MKKIIYPSFILLFSFLQMACSSDEQVLSSPMHTLNLETSFSTVEENWQTNAFPMTTVSQAPVSRVPVASTPVTRIALKIFASDGSVAYESTQRSTDGEFGSFSSIRLKPDTYKIVAVGHKASTTESEAATITSATQASLDETALYDTYAAVTDYTVSKSDFAQKQQTLTLNLCVSRLTVYVLDAIPADAAKIRLEVNTGKETFTSLSFNPTTRLFDNDVSYAKEWDVSGKIGESKLNFSVTAGFNVYPKTVSATVSALNADGDVVYTRTFDNLTMKRGKILVINTHLFTGDTSLDTDFEEWTMETVTVE